MDRQALVYRPWLHRYALLVVVTTFVLIAIGGTVTSTGAGMSVPDWPTTFGYNMFLAPLHVWWEHSDTFWEHSHRLMGSVVGLLTVGLAVWLAVVERRAWLIWLGLALVVLVILQGLAGGFRVTEASVTLAILHGIAGQVFLGLVVLAAAATSRLWVRYTSAAARAPGTPAAAEDEPVAGEVTALPGGLKVLSIAFLLALLVQLALGAWMRHHGAGLAIPDFPTAYGGVVPPVTQAEVDAMVRAYDLPRPYTPAQVLVHYGHRVMAAVIMFGALWMVVWLNLLAPGRPATAWPARWVMVLLAFQLLLGASVIWSGRYPEIATAHQAVGAALLAVAVWLTIRLHLLDRAGRAVGRRLPEAAPTATPGRAGADPADARRASLDPA